MTKIAIIGTNGVPSNYGGFETLVEQLVINLSPYLDITVFCSSKYCDVKLSEYVAVFFAPLIVILALLSQSVRDVTH